MKCTNPKCGRIHYHYVETDKSGCDSCGSPLVKERLTEKEKENCRKQLRKLNYPEDDPIWKKIDEA
jgi:predicted  nucleic acid-binding Zn-ribbon protein